MRCPFCRVDNDRVVDSRTSEDGFAIRRRRECMSCKRRYTTWERLEELSVKVIKKDGVREPFDRQKMLRGLQKACWKRPISDEQLEAIISDIASELHQRGDPEAPSREIGELVMERLRKLDEVAFVRFASVYREFKDVRDFVQELTPMLGEGGKRGEER